MSKGCVRHSREWTHSPSERLTDLSYQE
jgi:hypothetical protein